MRISRHHRCFSPADLWAAAYLSRVGAKPIVSKLSASDAAQPTAQQTPPNTSPLTLTPPVAQKLQDGYQEARGAIVKRLRVYPFPYGHVIGRPTSMKDNLKLRGLSNSDFAPVVSSSNPAFSSNAASTKCSASTPNTSTDKSAEATLKTPASTLSSSTSSATSRNSPTGPLHWPSFVELTREVERNVMTRNYLWDKSESQSRSCNHNTKADSSHATSTINSDSPLNADVLLTASPAYAATPSLLAFYPHSLLSKLAEHAIRHAWRGGPQIYPNGRYPLKSDLFQLQGCPALTVEDVACPDWDRAEAARFLLTTLQHRSIQKQLRRRLWSAAQKYHQDILRDVNSLAVTAADRSRSSMDTGRFVKLCSSGAPQTLVNVPLEDLKRQLFCFPAELHFTVKKLDANAGADTHSSAQLKAVLQPLRSSHWFHFTLQGHKNAVRILAERPHTNCFASSTTFARVSSQTRLTARPTMAWSTQEKLWLLLSEMTRLRCLVAYLLHLEVFLGKVRKAGNAAIHNCEQEMSDAVLMEEVFDFLDVQLSAQLQRRSHNSRFLSKYQISDGGAGLPVRNNETAYEKSEQGDGGDKSNLAAFGPSCSVTYQQQHRDSAACFATVQNLFTAFTKAMEGKTMKERVSSDAATVLRSCPDTPQDGKAKHVEEASLSSQLSTHASHPGAQRGGQLSQEDKSFLQAIVASRSTRGC